MMRQLPPTTYRTEDMLLDDLQRAMSDVFDSGALDPVQPPRMTATEIASREVEEMQRLGAAYERFADAAFKSLGDELYKIAKQGVVT